MEEKNIIGIILVVLSLVALCLQFITFPLFIIYHEYRSSMCFRIMLSIGILETLQLLSKLMMGFGMIVDFDFAGLPEQLIGGMLLSCWIMCVQQHLILAINRFAAIYQAEFYKSNWKEKVIFSGIMVLSWFWGAFFFFLGVSPICRIYFNDEIYKFSYAFGYQWDQLLVYLDTFSVLPCPFIGIFFYALILVRLIKQRKFFSQVTAARGPWMTAQEVRILIQSSSAFVFLCLLIAAFNIEIYLGWVTPKSIAAANSCWICFCGVGPVLYLTMNKNIRRRSLLLLRCTIEGNATKTPKMLTKFLFVTATAKLPSSANLTIVKSHVSRRLTH